MAWVRVESSVARHRKFLQAGPAPSWLWLCGLAYCQEGLTDGFIPTEALPHLGVGKQTAHLVARLVKVRLWDTCDGGWMVHDYLEHNKTASEVKRVREERGAGGKLGGRPKVNLEGKPSESPKANLLENPSTSTPTSTPTAVATSTTQMGPTTAPRGAPIHPKRNLHAAWEGSRGLYVVQGQHQKFVALLNSPHAELQLFAWYGEVSREWTDGARKHDNPGTDMVKFWEARHAEKWPVSKPVNGKVSPGDAWRPEGQ